MIEKISSLLGIEKDIFISILYIYCETCPHLDIVDDITDVLEGRKETFSEHTQQMFNRDQDKIKELAKFIKEQENVNN